MLTRSPASGGPHHELDVPGSQPARQNCSWAQRSWRSDGGGPSGEGLPGLLGLQGCWLSGSTAIAARLPANSASIRLRRCAKGEALGLPVRIRSEVICQICQKASDAHTTQNNSRELAVYHHSNVAGSEGFRRACVSLALGEKQQAASRRLVAAGCTSGPLTYRTTGGNCAVETFRPSDQSEKLMSLSL